MQRINFGLKIGKRKVTRRMILYQRQCLSISIKTLCLTKLMLVTILSMMVRMRLHGYKAVMEVRQYLASVTYDIEGVKD